MIYWGKHRHVMEPCGAWQSKKIGPGPAPIETTEGWLLIYHGVKKTCNGYCYYAGAAILDLDDPTKVLYRSKKYILSPREIYERVGDVDNVVFPCAALCDADTGRIALYYGAADTVVGIAFTTVDELIKFIKENSF
jgi:beta-1,4-mannooligosaccharide/beta-1,4-mannosyl-N-acetylglucosamine phosphorylase